MPMKNPPHPGRLVQSTLQSCNLNVTDAAKHLGVSRNTLSHAVNQEAGISPEMAVRISKAFGGSAGIWLRMQAAYDLAQVMENEDRIKVDPVLSESAANEDQYAKVA